MDRAIERPRKYIQKIKKGFSGNVWLMSMLVEQAFFYAIFLSLGLRLLGPIGNICGYPPTERIVSFTQYIYTREVRARLFSTADRCFPRARLQPPRETHSAGSSDTCCSRRSQRSSAPNNHRNSKSELYSAVANCTMLAMEIHVDSNGKAKRLLKKSM